MPLLPAARHFAVLGTASALLLSPAPSAAQSAGADSSAIPDSLFDAPSREALRGILARARSDSIPTAPLANRALQGASRRIGGAEAVATLRAHADSMRAARFALGTASTGDELDAGAVALVGGASRLTLRRLRLARPNGDAAVALVVLADLLGRGYPADDASTALLAVAGAAGDDAVLALQATVAREGTITPGGGGGRLRTIAERIAAQHGGTPPPAPTRVVIPPRRPR